MISIGRVRPTYKVETPGELRLRIKPDGNSAAASIPMVPWRTALARSSQQHSR